MSIFRKTSMIYFKIGVRYLKGLRNHVIELNITEFTVQTDALKTYSMLYLLPTILYIYFFELKFYLFSRFLYKNIKKVNKKKHIT